MKHNSHFAALRANQRKEDKRRKAKSKILNWSISTGLKKRSADHEHN